ncbi:tetratricopeptide repeat protein [Streptomyces fagopyri]|uniref:Tetratricopeptide repeat protein n=1 Tax=Streptomyces fagopyri TaxID=2662397 RepID=A0A5Q0L5S0_9ACTN|nr:BTAD domain-containing putative transcriptional regulator [Streptomyces fagopyri]QFZ71917.1 tetratricopeptide repeat protein [Streptomyces fagopyri]
MEESGLEALRFSLLGPLRAWRGSDELALGSPQQRAVLAMLLVSRGRAIGVADLVDGVWGARPPRGAVAVVRTYISRLRKLFEPERTPGRPSGLLVSIGDGYALRTDSISSDLADFEEAVTRAERRRVAGDGAGAVRLLRTVPATGNGAALAGVPGPYAESARTDLAERQLGALELRLSLELELDRHEAAVPELLALRNAHPLREAVVELLLTALYQCGRQAEALDVYASTRRVLVDELGIEPGPSLRAVHARILAGDPALARLTFHGPTGDARAPHSSEAVPSPEPDGPSPGRRAKAVNPAQLPADHALFIGRRMELDYLATLLPEGNGPPSAAVIAVIDGMAGTGKTTLAVHWAHRIAHRFPDGSLYVNLRGFDPHGSRLLPGSAIEMFLVALGVGPQAVPEGLDAQAALYRSILADRRVLIVLDNARDAEQVRPLLPGTPGSLVIVTSRNRLGGLVAGHGAHPLTPGLLSAEESYELLSRRLGDTRVDAEPQAVAAITELCARLPLALAIVAARAAHHPGFKLADVAQELRSHHGSLDAFVGDDAGTDARAVFSWSYQALSSEAAGLFRRLALHPGPDITTVAATALAGAPPRRVRVLLTELTGASLLIEHAPGRFVFHDLLRTYSGELAETEDSESSRGAALLRMHDHFLRTAHNASSVLDPFRETIDLPPSATGSEPRRFNDRAQASTWLRTERYVLSAIVEHAAAHGFDEHAWRTAAGLDVYFNRLGFWHDLLKINSVALASARKIGDPIGQAYALCGLGVAHSQLNHAEPALEYLERSLELFRSAGNPFGQARGHRALAYLANRTDGRGVALEHYAQARALFRAEADRNGEAGVLNQVAWTYILIGDHEVALNCCRESLALYETMDDPYGVASTQDTLGYAYHHLGQYPEAIVQFERSARLFAEIGDRYLESDVLRHLADTHRATGDKGAARAALRSALALLEEVGHSDAEGVSAVLSDLDA